MSFRLRVITLVMLIAVTATAATAWLTLQQATRQIDETFAASQQESKLITTGLADYARSHGTWYGLMAKVRQLSTTTGQRIRLTTTSGALIVDSDMLVGAAPRDTSGPPVLVDPRPRWQPAFDLRAVPANGAVKLMALAIVDYRASVQYADCLTGDGAAVRMSLGSSGVPEYKAIGATRQVITDCTTDQKATDLDKLVESPEFVTAIRRCYSADSGQLDPCLQNVFINKISEFAPLPVEVYIGAARDPAPHLKSGSIVAAAGVVSMIAVIASWLLSRRVLRPIGALTSASRQIGEGDLAKRVPAAGRDELAELGHAFNRMADSLQASEERQRRMTADVAHELRTPLANLRGYLEALKDGILPPTPELFASLLDEAVLQQRIIEDLQDLVLAEAGAYHKTRLDLAELITSCRAAHGAAAAAAGVDLVTVGGGPLWVDGDADRLRQVIGNLLRNALAATAQGGKITLAATTVDSQHAITVTDTGTGIAEVDLPHLFDRFWRADPARTRTSPSSGGSGLGLAIARQIITDHGGTIAVTSQLGAGTTFTIRLTACDAAQRGSNLPRPPRLEAELPRDHQALDL